MILHSTENCFWLMVYLTRVKNSSQYLISSQEVILSNHHLLKIPSHFPLIEASAGFDKIEKADVSTIIEKLTWNPDFENSIYANFKQARSNANLIRTLLPEEFWISLNSLWIWLNEKESLECYKKNPNEFYTRLIELYHLLQGIIHEEMLHDKTYHFMRIGVLLEQIVAQIKVIHLSFEFLKTQKTDDHDQFWIAILKGLQAWEPFHQSKTPRLSIDSITQFLLCDPSYPHSTHFCLNELNKSLQSTGYLNCKPINTISNTLLILEKVLKEKQQTNSPSHLIVKLENEIETLFDTCIKHYFDGAL